MQFSKLSRDSETIRREELVKLYIRLQNLRPGAGKATLCPKESGLFVALDTIKTVAKKGYTYVFIRSSNALLVALSRR